MNIETRHERNYAIVPCFYELVIKIKILLLIFVTNYRLSFECVMNVLRVIIISE